MNSLGSSYSTSLVQKKYQIELNIRLLYIADPKFHNQSTKIFWTRGKKNIDTRAAIINQDTHIAKFNDKFSMKTILQWDESRQDFVDKPTFLIVVQLEKDETGETNDLTGNQSEIGRVDFNLAKYARQQSTSEKLYLNDLRDMYIEIGVKSRPVDPEPTSTEKQDMPPIAQTA